MNRIKNLGDYPLKPKQPQLSPIQKMIRAWLEQFQFCVNQLDYAQAETLFAPSVIGFTSASPFACGIKELREQEWEKEWPLSEHFEFAVRDARGLVGNPYVTCCTLWTAKLKDGTRRVGRCTLLFGAKPALIIQNGDKKFDGLICFHSHFSDAPKEVADS